MLNLKKIICLNICVLILIGCSKQDTSVDSQNKVEHSKKESVQPTETNANIDPEDDIKFKGTNVLGFKLRDSTFTSVKKRLVNYQYDKDNLSYLNGPILENDGAGFDIDGLLFTQFGFDDSQKLHYVYMALAESDHMNKVTYKKIVNYIKQNNYQLIREKAPFVGDQLTEFKTPNNEYITVSAPHMGGFKVFVEYLTDEFQRERNNVQQEQKKNKANNEASNF